MSLILQQMMCCCESAVAEELDVAAARPGRCGFGDGCHELGAQSIAGGGVGFDLAKENLESEKWNLQSRLRGRERERDW